MENNILCCDWGTSSFRLRLVDSLTFEVKAELQSSDGVASVFRSWQDRNSESRFDVYSEKLKSKIDELANSSGLELNNFPVIVSGMASSTIGMEEVAYANLPFAANGSQASAKLFENFNGQNPLLLVSGVRSQDDVMRGEEAQLIGLFGLKNEISVDEKDAIFVFPGTHSKHIFIKNEQIVDFQTFMTGEIFNIISEHSILKDSIENSGSGLTNSSNQAAFKAGVERSGSSNLLHTLFTVRTNQLFGKFTKEENTFYLSGLLIGSELRELSLNTQSQLIICSGRHLFDHYKIAASVLQLKENLTFIQPELIDKATIAGQVQLFKALTNHNE